jgi:hypothetical protein
MLEDVECILMFTGYDDVHAACQLHICGTLHILLDEVNW